MYRAGLRVSEALALRPADVNLTDGTVRVLHGKGDKPRTVGLDPGAVDAVYPLDGQAPRVRLPQRPAVLHPGRRPGRGRYVRDMLKRQAAKAGLEKRVHPHGLRHTHAAELVREGVPINVIRDQLGHSSWP